MESTLIVATFIMLGLIVVGQKYADYRMKTYMKRYHFKTIRMKEIEECEKRL